LHQYYLALRQLTKAEPLHEPLFGMRDKPKLLLVYYNAFSGHYWLTTISCQKALGFNRRDEWQISLDFSLLLRYTYIVAGFRIWRNLSTGGHPGCQACGEA